MSPHPFLAVPVIAFSLCFAAVATMGAAAAFSR
jgi:hypothetical protein